MEHNLDHLRGLYETAFSKHGDSPESVLWPKGRQDIRFHALTKNIAEKAGFSVLDFGCGLAHMKPYIDGRFEDVSYSGVDMLKVFVDESKSKYPDAVFHHLEFPAQLSESYDYVLSSGAFNALYTPDPKEHRDIVFGILDELFAKTNVYLSINFMSDAVDFQQENSYHQNVTELQEHVSEKLSRRLVIDLSYMPYEFTMTIWKEQDIRRPENIYGNGLLHS